MTSRSSPIASPTSCSTTGSREKFDGWPYFVSTAPGVAYAYLKDYRRNRADIYHQADTLADWRFDACSVATSSLQRSEDYNATAANAASLTRKPYYALGPVKSYVVFTDGGLKVTERLEVLREDGSRIPGAVCCGFDRTGWPAARRPRPSSRLGVHLRAALPAAMRHSMCR